MDSLHSRVLEIYSLAKTLHEEGFSKLARLRSDLAKEPNLNDIVDVVAVLKKIESRLKDSKQEVAKALSQLQKGACMLYLAEGRLGETITTEWVTANPNPRTQPKIPERGTDAYQKLCEHFGVPQALIDSATFRPHWPSLVEYCTEQEAALKPLPPGINPNDVTTEYTVVCRFRNSADVDDLLRQRMEEDPYG